jgi:hypothetical protein
MSLDGPQAVWGPLAERLRMVPAPHINASLSVAEFQREVLTAFSIQGSTARESFKSPL